MTTLLEQPRTVSQKPARLPVKEGKPAEAKVGAPASPMESRPAPGSRTQIERAVEVENGADPQPSRRWLKQVVVGAALAAAIVAGGRYGWSYWQWAAVHESTDDAFIDGHVVQVTPRVAGHVAKVYVADNQLVHRGEVLAELDASDFQAALDQAEGKLAGARADLLAAQSQVDQAQAQIATAHAQVLQAQSQEAAKQAEFERSTADLKNYTTAHNLGVVSSIEWSKAQTEVRTTQAALDAAKTAVIAAEAQVVQASATEKVQEGQVAVARAGIASAEAAVQQARLNLSYTKIVASVDGRVTKKTIEPGDYVVPAQLPALLGLVSNDVWVTANFKETQLAHMKPGQRVDVKVDAYPGVAFHGHLDSVQQGAGSWFSLLPPENATGNYVKVVQRVPVKIDLDEVDPRYLLGPGMSVVPEVLIKE